MNNEILKLQIRIAYLEAMLAAIAVHCDSDTPTSRLIFEIKNVANGAIRGQKADLQ